MSGGPEATPGVVQHASDVIDLVQDVVTGNWTPRQREQGQSIADGLKRFNEGGAVRDAYRLGAIDFQAG